MRKIISDLTRQALIVAAVSAAVLAAGFGGPYDRGPLSPASLRIVAPIRANAVSFPTAAICPAPMRPWGALSADAANLSGQATSPSCATAAPTLLREGEPASRSRTDLALAR
jgi:hypothetical protein